MVGESPVIHLSLWRQLSWRSKSQVKRAANMECTSIIYARSLKKNLYWCKIVVIFLQNVIKLTTIRLCRRMSNEIWHSAGFWEELHVVGWSYEMFTNFGRFFVCFFDVTYWLPWRSQRRQLAKLWEMALY